MKNYKKSVHRQRIRTTMSPGSNVQTDDKCHPRGTKSGKSSQRSKKAQSSIEGSSELNDPKRRQHVSGDCAASNLVLHNIGRQLVQQAGCTSPHQEVVTSTLSNARTLEICLRAIDSKVLQKRRNPTIDEDQSIPCAAESKVRKVTSEKLGSWEKVPVQTTPKGKHSNTKDPGAILSPLIGACTPLNRQSTDFSEDSPSVPSGSLTDPGSTPTNMNQSFQMDVLNLGYSHSPRQPASPAVKVNSQEATESICSFSVKKMFRITAPLYYCNSGGAKTVPNGKRKGNVLRRRSAKRQLCTEVHSSPAQSLLHVPKLSILNLGAPMNENKTRDFRVIDTNDGPLLQTEIWLSPCLQMDTMGCNSSGGVKKDFNRGVVVCVTGSPFCPQSAVSSYPDAINTRVTYDRDGQIAVLEVADTLSPGIYRIIHTRVAMPHQCLHGKVAMETLLVKRSSISNLKPHSQYLVLNEIYKVPKRKWRERLSATVVRLRMEDFLHTYKFHSFALPLLLWNGDEDNWSWTREPVKKFHAIRKNKLVSRKTHVKKNAKCMPPLIAPKITDKCQQRTSNKAL